MSDLDEIKQKLCLLFNLVTGRKLDVPLDGFDFVKDGLMDSFELISFWTYLESEFSEVISVEQLVLARATAVQDICNLLITPESVQ